MPKQKFKLGKFDRVVCCWCETASGPGWGNYFVKVLVADKDHNLRIEWIQPDMMNRDISTLFNTGNTLHNELKRAVEALIRENK